MLYILNNIKYFFFSDASTNTGGFATSIHLQRQNVSQERYLHVGPHKVRLFFHCGPNTGLTISVDSHLLLCLLFFHQHSGSRLRRSHIVACCTYHTWRNQHWTPYKQQRGQTVGETWKGKSVFRLFKIKILTNCLHKGFVILSLSDLTFSSLFKGLSKSFQLW